MHDANNRSALPTVALLVSERLQRDIFTPHALAQLASLAHVISFTDHRRALQELPELLQRSLACITGWDTPPLTDEMLDSCPNLRMIAHTAGSVRFLLPEDVFERGICVSHANAALSEGVAEFVILQALLVLRRVCNFDRRLKAGEQWIHEQGRLLRTQTFGLVGVGSIARDVIVRLKPFGCRILVYDPYLSHEDAQALQVEVVDIQTLFSSSDIVSLHAPLLPATHNMIGAAELALLRPGTIFINTARAGLVDESALLDELRTGRFTAILDVFHEEPLSLDSPLRAMSNVILTPHIAALTTDTLQLQGQLMVDEIQRFLHNEALLYEVTRDKFLIMA